MQQRIQRVLRVPEGAGRAVGHRLAPQLRVLRSPYPWLLMTLGLAAGLLALADPRGLLLALALLVVMAFLRLAWSRRDEARKQTAQAAQQIALLQEIADGLYFQHRREGDTP